MVQFYPLTVTDIQRDTRDSVIVTLTPADDVRDKFTFIQGQYLTFRREFDGDEKRRSYSICAGIDDGILRVGVKKVEGGWFSSWMNDELQVDQIVEAMPPMGKFHSPLDPKNGKRYLGFAGGSGITPMVSLVKTILKSEPTSSFTLLYGNRSVSSIMFREELEELKNIYMERFSLLHVLESQSADMDLFSGRLDREKCDALFKSWIDVTNSDLAFICGPEPMMLAIADALKAHGMPEKAIKFELFSSPKTGRAKKRVVVNNESGEVKTAATIIVGGTSHQCDIIRGEQSVLEAALEAKIDTPYACKAGVCSTCIAKLVKGEVEMESNFALEDYEVERGYILTCQSHPVTDEVVVDYDQ